MVPRTLMLPLAAVVLLSAVTALPSTNMFDSESTQVWIDGICSTDNSTCRAKAGLCYGRFKRARTVLTTINNPRLLFTLTTRCQQQRRVFDTCADEAQLNATWASITGQKKSCDRSFLRRIRLRGAYPNGGGMRNLMNEFLSLISSGGVTPGRFRRSNPQLAHGGRFPSSQWLTDYQQRQTNGESELNYNNIGDYDYSPDGRRRQGNRNRFWRRRRLLQGGGGRRSRRSISPTTRVIKFMERVESENPEAIANYTTCVHKQEGLLHPNGTVDRGVFSVWAQVAFVYEPDLKEAVLTAIQNCSEPEGGDVLSEYMQCWGEVCVQNLALD